MAARAIDVKLQILSIRGKEQFDSGFEAAVKARAEALIVLPSASFQVHRQRLIDLAAHHRLFTVWEHRVFTFSGGLMSYGPDIADMYRSAARYVDKILKGAKPADLPVEQVGKHDLVVNLKTAKALGITIPLPLLVRANHVIE